jgi:hypothetical protein
MVLYIFFKSAICFSLHYVLQAQDARSPDTRAAERNRHEKDTAFPTATAPSCKDRASPAEPDGGQNQYVQVGQVLNTWMAHYIPVHQTPAIIASRIAQGS